MAGRILRLQMERPAHAAMYWVPGVQAEQDMAKHLQRRPGRDGCQLAWSPQDRQCPRQMDTSRPPMLRKEQADLIPSK